MVHVNWSGPGVVTAGYCEGERRGVIGKQEGGQGDIVKHCVTKLLQTPDTRQGDCSKNCINMI